MKWVCLHCTNSVIYVYWTNKSQVMSLKVDFLFQSFLVILSCLVVSFFVQLSPFLFCRLLSVLVVSCLFQSSLSLSSLVQSCPVLSIRVLSCLVVSFLILSWLFLLCPVISSRVLSFLVLSCLVLVCLLSSSSCLILLFLLLSCLAMSLIDYTFPSNLNLDKVLLLICTLHFYLFFLGLKCIVNF